jgi:copper ion binding protein
VAIDALFTGKAIMMKTVVMKVNGMTCNGCAGAVSRAVGSVSGVTNVVVSLASGKATVTLDEALASVDDVSNAINRAGYGVDQLRGAAQQERCCRR